MLLLDFIKENKNWRDILSKKPYYIGIKEKNGYALFKYRQGESDMSNPLVQECRGVIIDLLNMTVSCRPFDKFFNYNEDNSVELSGAIRAEQKIDGCLMKIWLDRDGMTWNLSTNGMIDANDVPIQIPHDNINTFADLFDVAWAKCNISMSDLGLMKDYTFMFELVSPFNRVVIPYQDTEIYFLGVRNNETGEEIDPASLQEDVNGILTSWHIIHNIKVPHVYGINSLSQAIEVAKDLSDDEEGFVLVDGYFNRVKVKGTKYLANHLLRSNTLSSKDFLTAVLEGKDDDMIAYFPEYKEYIDNIRDKITNYIECVNKVIKSTNFNVDRKEFAQSIKDSEYKNILFRLYDNNEYDWVGYTFNVDNINAVMRTLDI